MPTVVQITDLHLFADLGGRLLDVPTWQCLDDALDALQGASIRWDCLVITGDIAQDHLAGTYALLRDRLSARFPGRVRDIEVLPGNHDDPALLAAAFARPRGPDASFARTCGDWLLLGLDSHLPGAVEGKVSDEQVRWLARTMDENPDRSCLVFVHHPPAPVGAEWLDGMGLLEPGALGEVLGERAEQVAAVVCGHVHQDCDTGWAGVRVLTTPATAFQFAVGSPTPAFDSLAPGMRILELGAPGEARLRTWVLRAAERRFPPLDPGAGGY